MAGWRLARRLTATANRGAGQLRSRPTALRRNCGPGRPRSGATAAPSDRGAAADIGPAQISVQEIVELGQAGRRRRYRPRRWWSPPYPDPGADIGPGDGGASRFVSLGPAVTSSRLEHRPRRYLRKNRRTDPQGRFRLRSRCRPVGSAPVRVPAGPLRSGSAPGRVGFEAEFRAALGSGAGPDQVMLRLSRPGPVNRPSPALAALSEPCRRGVAHPLPSAS
jgi:hypothetical protein